MHDRRSRDRRLRLGTVALAAVLLVIGVAPAAVQAAGADQPGPNETAADADMFSGYIGYVGDGTAASSVGAEVDKTEDLGPVGSNPADAEDVPGTTVEAEPDAPVAGASSSVTGETAVGDDVRSTIAEQGSARVIVHLRTETRIEADLSASQVDAQRAGIADALDALAGSLVGTGSEKLFEFDVVPAAVYEIGEEGLDALLADPTVASVTLDGQVQGQLDSSTGVIDSDLLNAAGVLGDNFEGGTGAYQVAIIDSGVDGGHNAFAGRIVNQACFVGDFSCPGGTNAFVGAPGGEECTHSDDCDHGTHVGGIAAGAAYTGGHEGVARGAGIVAIKVAQDSPTSNRWTALFSSIDAGLQHVIDLKTSTNPNLVSVNLSIGTSSTFSAGDPACDALDPTTDDLFAQLQGLGVAVVVAAGNNGDVDGMSFPGCLPNAFAIGATDDFDVPASFTNSSADMRWWAPGVGIDAPVPTGDAEGNKSGTSMAAPHVAGAFALLRECVDGNGVPQTNAAAAADLDATGVSVTRNGVTKQRINVLDAATRNVNNNDFAFAEVIPAAGLDDFDFNVCADAETGEPGPFSVDNSIWWTWTPSATGTATISTEDSAVNFTTFDTTLTVYTGSTLGSLTTVAFDDDSGTGLRSLVVFPVQGGTTYRIKVDGFAATNGLLNLHVENGPAPTCGGAPATIVGTINAETIDGTAGVDVIVAGDGNDTINGLGGADSLCAGAGEDTVDGGTGADFAAGGPGADVVNGNGGNDLLLGNAGGGDTNDVGDTMDGGTGNDIVDGWVGDDTLVGGLGDDILFGEDGNDTVSYSDAATGVDADLTAGTATGAGNDSFVGVENLLGSLFADNLTGDANANILRGDAGSDDIDGLDGPDTLTGGAGNDTVGGQAGPDTLNGLAGVDVLNGGGGTDLVNGGDGVDTINGGDGPDTLNGGNAGDVITGGDGPDTLNGGAGADNLSGNTANDDLNGGAANDVLNGGSGVDDCDGGTGADAGAACEVVVGIP